MNQAIPASKNHSIETLRAAAVVLVFMNHLHSLNILSIPYFGISGGWMGVQIFFVISGYLIIQSALRYSASDYIRHRVLRIYPAYILWFFVFLIIFKQFQWNSIDAKSLLIHLLFLQHFFPDAYLKYNPLSVSWTLTIEMVWYVVAFFIATRFVKSPTKITAVFVCLACFWAEVWVWFSCCPKPIVSRSCVALDWDGFSFVPWADCCLGSYCPRWS